MRDAAAVRLEGDLAQAASAGYRGVALAVVASAKYVVRSLLDAALRSVTAYRVLFWQLQRQVIASALKPLADD